MAAAAARQALEAAGVAPESLTCIVHASGTPEQCLPDGGPLLQRELGLGGSGIRAFSVHATCLSFLVGLETACMLLARADTPDDARAGPRLWAAEALGAPLDRRCVDRR